MKSTLPDASISLDVVAPNDTEREEEYVNKPILAANMRIIRKVAAYIMLTGVYSFTYLAALLGSIIPHRPWKPTGRILVTGTFHNPGWYLSHVTPLTHSGVKEIILVVDEPQLPLERVRFVCPPKWVSRLLSRACAKAIWMIITGLRYRPDLYMGYHLAPGACSALMAGKLLGRPSCYQMTGGPAELIGSGFNTIASFDKNFEQRSKVIESMAIRVIRQFDLVVVRGNKAKEFLARQGIEEAVAIITGSVNGCTQPIKSHREIDLIFVGRLCPIKQVHQLIAVVHAIRRIMPNIRAAIVGDGPLMASLRACAERLGLTDNIKFLGKREDVEALLVCSKIFVLTSKSEGLSIAMAEAMAVGTVPVVANVGELGDLVIDGVNGYLVEPNRIDEYTKRVISLLQDTALWEKYSLKAIETARIHCDVEIVSKKWQQNFRDVVSQASGVNT
jgi:glycosyltransferase involved in cell wall biosynthesis